MCYKLYWSGSLQGQKKTTRILVCVCPCVWERWIYFKALTCTMVGADKSKFQRQGQPTGDPGKAIASAQSSHLETEFPLP